MQRNRLGRTGAIVGRRMNFFAAAELVIDRDTLNEIDRVSEDIRYPMG